MARSKSTSGGKASRPNSNSSSKEQTGTSSPANIPDVKAAAAGTTPAEAAAEVKTVLEPRKLEVVKPEFRKVVPINQGPTSMVPISTVPTSIEDEIRRRAYELYLQRGPSSGSEAEDWLTAEREVRQRYHQQSA